MTEAFLYCWTDTKTNKLYVGVHKGSEQDGYICSSKLMMNEYRNRPDDFIREVVANGSYNDVRSLERAILKSVDAARNPEFYNRHNADSKFYNLKHSEETKRKI